MKKLSIILFSLIMITPAQADQQLSDYFFAAAKTGQTEILTEFLDNGFPVDHRNNQSYTALMMATYHGHKKAVNILLRHGANACLKDKRGHTAIMGAMVKAEWTIAKILYQKECRQAYTTGKTLEEFAKIFGQTERLNALSAGQ